MYLTLTFRRTEVPIALPDLAERKTKSPQKRLQSVFESLWLVFSFNRVCAYCDMLHNTNFELCGMVFKRANRLCLICYFIYQQKSLTTRASNSFSKAGMELSEAVFFAIRCISFDFLAISKCNELFLSY